MDLGRAFLLKTGDNGGKAIGEARARIHVHRVLAPEFAKGLLEADDLSTVGKAFFGGGDIGLFGGCGGRVQNWVRGERRQGRSEHLLRCFARLANLSAVSYYAPAF